MAFDQSTRNRLQKLVSDCRKLLSQEFSIQLQQTYGIDPHSGEVAGLDRLTHLSDRDRQTAQLLRDTLAHYLAVDADDKDHRIAAIDRIIREQAFTVLNRLAALLMMEARGLLAAAVVSQGQQSQAFELYKMVSGSSLGETGEAYRTFLFSLFDEFAIDLPALFDRYAAQGRLFPREPALLEVLDALNQHEIQSLWAEDETIGWIYQYFNSKEERKAMRDASQAPRNSRELAVRNQFFTPRYVVEFLVDNTLGRMWFNATGGQTELRERCQYLLVKPDEQQQASLRLRDPRTLKLLDPACGSMHFGLYAFDLFLQLYQEAWDWEQTHGPGSLDVSTQQNSGLLPLCQTYPDREAYQRDVPRLIVEHNIYGVDIDPRAAQIASLALWLRAQRAWHDAGVKSHQRPDIGRGHVVAAVAPPAERELRQQFTIALDKRDAVLFEKTLQLLKLLPELGLLLQVERELPRLIRQVYVGVGTGLFAAEESESWEQAETRLRVALVEFAQTTKSSYQARLFAQDALEGLRIIDLCREAFDVVVMNPPFGEYTLFGKEYSKKNYTCGGHDLITSFIQSGLIRLRDGGCLGAITSRTCFFAPTTKKWREDVFLGSQVDFWVDLGAGVLDGAMVETCAFVVSKKEVDESSYFFDAKKISFPELLCAARNKLDFDERVYKLKQDSFRATSGSPFSNWKNNGLLTAEQRLKSLSDCGVTVRVGLQTGDDFRFIRCWWECPLDPKEWYLHAKGGQNEPFATDIHLLVNWKAGGLEIKGQDSVRLNMFSRVEPSRDLEPGLTFAYRTNRFSPGIMPRGVVPGVAGMGVYSDNIDLTALLAILNSSVVNELIDSRLANRDTQALYQAGVISPIPFPDFLGERIFALAAHAAKNWACAIYPMLFNPASLLFSSYFFDAKGLGVTSRVVNREWTIRRNELSSVYSLIDKEVLDSYGFDYADYDDVTSKGRLLFMSVFPSEISAPAYEAEKLVYLAVANVTGLPVSVCDSLDDAFTIDMSEYIAGQSLYKRVDSLHKGVGVFDSSEICDAIKSLMLSLFENQEAVHNEFLSVVGYTDIVCYLDSPTGFFDSHLKRYSKSRRKAPIYWPLATASGSYTLWLYYPSLNDQTLFTAVNDFVDPKLEGVRKEQQTLRDKGAGRSKQEEKSLEVLVSLEHELADLRDSLLEIAPNYRPNHDDGVQITASPLWKLFRHKAWQKVLKDTWVKLEKGDYDWAHLAMNYWPDRVRDKCVTDKSLAIAHGLEHLYVEPEPVEKKTRGRKKAGSTE